MNRAGMAVAAAVAAWVNVAAPAMAEEEGTWPSIRDALFEGRELKDGNGLIALEAPKRAQDAAVVPVTVRALQPQTPGRYIKTVHLIVDENPAPIAGVFHLYPETGNATIGTRIRVDQYTNLHAVAETSDGELHVVERFIKAAGGCSAPGLKDKELAMARLGRMQLKPMTSFAPGEANEAQLLISHPNYTGMQIDQLTRLWIPPDYVQSVKVSYGGTPVLEVEGDIALSEDPAISFSFVPEAPAPMVVQIADSKGRKFEQSWPIGSAS
jgi:sulfur-oxidizing protein SoxY